MNFTKRDYAAQYSSLQLKSDTPILPGFIIAVKVYSDNFLGSFLFLFCFRFDRTRSMRLDFETAFKIFLALSHFSFTFGSMFRITSRKEILSLKIILGHLEFMYTT
jgi:hypothetical protein